MSTQAIFTIVSNNYLHYARTLMQSVAVHHPDAKRFCVIVDSDMQPAADLASEFTAIELQQLQLPHGEEFLFQYSILELNTAVKPWALQYLLDQGYENVLYIDPDIYLYRPLEEVVSLLQNGAGVVLTPHLLAPPTDKLMPTDLAIRTAGTYNLGFCAVSDKLSTRAFLTWWQSKLERDCVVDFANGIFVDQSWIDLVPAMFDDVAVLRHPGYNVAYWNLAQRDMSGDLQYPLVNDQPLAFFHFSGIDPLNPQAISKHQNRFKLATVSPTVRALFMAYCESVIANGQAKYRELPYGFGRFKDGSPIAPAQRTHFRLNEEVRAQTVGSPFDRPIEPTDIAGARLISIYSYFLQRRPEASMLAKFSSRCDSPLGYLRVAVGVGRSPESRRHPYWKRRLMLWPFWELLQAMAPEAKGILPVKAVANASAATKTDPTNMPGPYRETVAATGVNLVGYIAAELGLGEAVRSLARACSASNIPYSVVDVGYQSSNLQRDTQALANARNARFPIDVVYVNADQTETTLQHLSARGLTSGYKIGFWHWEQPSIPAAHLAAFAGLDEIWVPSTFVYHAVAAVSPVPVVIIPHALQVRASPGVHRSQFGLPEDKVIALVMYDFHSYQYRKNPQAAIAAFRQAVQDRADALLVVKTINGEHHAEAAAELNVHLANLPGTVVIDQFLTRQETWDLQSCCDILISLHRGEGFGLAPAEMMALGKAVVATGWSANMDFMTHENSMPVSYRLAPLDVDVGAYPAGPLWAEADVAHAAACIARLLDDPDLRRRLGQKAAQDINERFSPEVVGRLVHDRLLAIQTWNPELLAIAASKKAA